MNDWQHTAAATRDAAIAERTGSWVDTRTAATHICLQRSLSGNVLWTLWKCTDIRGRSVRYIGCDELSANRVGWSFRSFKETNVLTHVSCPLAFLDEAPVVSLSWRRAVAAYWRGEEMFPTATVKRHDFRAGDRVSYSGPNSRTLTSGLLGVVINAPGAGHAHPDRLKRTTYVRWENGREEAVFNVHLRD